MLVIRSWPCPKCTFILLYIALDLKACTINNASGASTESKKVRDVSEGGGGRSPEERLQIDMRRFPKSGIALLKKGG